MIDTQPWTVDGLIETAQKIMVAAPDLFTSASTGSARDLNVRLIRDYVVREFIPRPGRSGRDARFGLDHLVYLLAIRALLRNQKWSLPAIKASFASTTTEELLSGTLAQLRPLIEREFTKASQAAKPGSSTADASRVQTPALNPALELIEKFKAGKSSSSAASVLHRNVSTKAGIVPPVAMDAPVGLSDQSATMLHLRLNEWCEVVIDARRAEALTPGEVELLADSLKRRLHKGTA